MSLDPSIPSPMPSRSPWPRVAALLGLATVVAIAGLLMIERITSTPSAALDKGVTLVKELGHQAATVAGAFQGRSVRQEFLSSAVTLTGTSRLQVATLQEH